MEMNDESSPQMKVGDHIWNDRAKTTDQLLRVQAKDKDEELYIKFLKFKKKKEDL